MILFAFLAGMLSGASLLSSWIVRGLKVLLVIALLGSLVHAQAKITVAGNEQLRPMVQQIAESLKAPLPTWGIIILTESQWANATERFHTESAFTIIASRHTFIRERFVYSQSAKEIRYTLAHEAAHVITNSMKETDANRVAKELLKANRHPFSYSLPCLRRGCGGGQPPR